MTEEEKKAIEDKTVLELFKDYININKRIRTEKRELKFINKIIKISKKYGYKLYRNDIDKEKCKKIIINTRGETRIMSEEEKRAIEQLKKLNKIIFYNEYKNYFIDNMGEIDNAIHTILNLIEKLQKENEELKIKNNNYEEGIILSKKQLEMVTEGIKIGIDKQLSKEMKKFIPKDKIKAILEDEIEDVEIIYHIKELLEEE